MKNQINHFQRKFNEINVSTIMRLEKCCITVMTVVFMLTSIRALDEHKVFLSKEHRRLCECRDCRELFGELNLYWNYLAYDLLDQLIEELTLKCSAFKAIAEEMAKYKKDMQDFRQRTTLKLFCQAQTEFRAKDPPPGFKKMVITHSWPQTITLEDVERFR